MKLVKFMCAAKGHSTARSDSALTIHEGVWAFCYAGGQTPGHDWKAVDGMPLNDAMRFAQAVPPPSAPRPAARRATAAAPKDTKAGPR